MSLSSWIFSFKISSLYISELSFDAIAALLLSFASEIYLADPAVSALTLPDSLLFYKNSEAWLKAWACEYTFVISFNFEPLLPIRLWLIGKKISS